MVAVVLLLSNAIAAELVTSNLARYSTKVCGLIVDSVGRYWAHWSVELQVY